MLKLTKLTTSLSRLALAASVCGIPVLGCSSDDSTLITPVPAVHIQLVPSNATVIVGDTVQFVGVITGGSSSPKPNVELCIPTSPNVASTIRSLTDCRVVGVSAGTSDIVVMASTGHRDTATVVVVPR